MTVSVRLTWALVCWALGLVASAMAGGVVLAAQGDDSTLEDLSLGWTVLIQTPWWIVIGGGLLLARRRGLRWRAQLGWSMRPSDVAVGIGAGLVVQLVLVPLLYFPLFRLFDDLQQEDVEEVARNLTDSAHTTFDVVMLLVMVVVMAPLVEELLFRGMVQGALVERFGTFVGITGASLLFAVAHFQVLQFPALLLVGVCLGVLVRLTKRIGAAIWAHVTFNTITAVVLLWA